MTELLDKNTQPATWIASALESLGLAMLTTDKEGVIDRINANACRILGLSESRAMGRPVDELLLLWDAQGEQPMPFPTGQMLEAGSRISAQDGWRLHLPPGGRAVVNVSAAPIRDDLGRTIGAVLTLCEMEPWKISDRSLSEQKVLNREELGLVAEPVPARQSMYVRSNGRYIRVMVDELLWVEAMENYVHVQTTKERLTVHTTLKSIAGSLAQKGCQRIHRSFLVKLDAIETIEENHVTVAGTTLPIGKSYRADLLDAITLL